MTTTHEGWDETFSDLAAFLGMSEVPRRESIMDARRLVRVWNHASLVCKGLEVGRLRRVVLDCGTETLLECGHIVLKDTSPKVFVRCRHC